MGKIYLAAAMMSLLLVGGSVNTAYADICSDLIAFGTENLKSVEDDDLRDQIQELLNQAQTHCDGGNTTTGIQVAQQAIELIK